MVPVTSRKITPVGLLETLELCSKMGPLRSESTFELSFCLYTPKTLTHRRTTLPKVGTCLRELLVYTCTPYKKPLPFTHDYCTNMKCLPRSCLGKKHFFVIGGKRLKKKTPRCFTTVFFTYKGSMYEVDKEAECWQKVGLTLVTDNIRIKKEFTIGFPTLFSLCYVFP